MSTDIVPKSEYSYDCTRSPVMFYENFTDLCKIRGFSPTSILQKLNISTSKLTAWKNGSMPNASFVVLIAEFFNVSTDYLLTGKEKISSLELTENEQRIIDIFKSLTETQQGQVIERAEMLSESNEDKN